jgi:hypothetical protein
MIVVFKTGAPPHTPAGGGLKEPLDRPITAVEKCWRYLIYWITIIIYNIKAWAVSAGYFQPNGIASFER